MTDLLNVVPDLDVQAFSHIIPSLEKSVVTSTDLLTVDAIDIAKRARVPTEEVRRLVGIILDRLRGNNVFIHSRDTQQPQHTESQPRQVVSLLDEDLDRMLNGGIHSGYVTEVAGESAAGKTQLLLTLLLSVQLPSRMIPGRNALYISTEAQLSTKRLAQILQHHPKLSDVDGEAPSLDRIFSTHVRDLESQEHILRYQVPVLIERHNIGLVVIDSIAANYRAELDKTSDRRATESLAQRSLQIGRIGAHLRALARLHDVAVVLANQVADRFDSASVSSFAFSQSTHRSRSPSPPLVQPQSSSNVVLPLVATSISALPSVVPSVEQPLTLDHQQRFFTGWGDDPQVTALKTPSLGLTWTTQLATRIVLLKAPTYQAEVSRPMEEKILTGWIRSLKVVFSTWSRPGVASFEVWQGGIRSKLVVEPPLRP